MRKERRARAIQATFRAYSSGGISRAENEQRIMRMAAQPGGVTQQQAQKKVWQNGARVR